MEVHYINIASDKPEFLPLPKLLAELKRKGIQFDRQGLLLMFVGGVGTTRFYVVRPPTWKFEL